MAQVNIHEAKTQLSSLVARVEQGEEIIGSSGGTVGALASELATTAGRWRWRLAM